MKTLSIILIFLLPFACLGQQAKPDPEKTAINKTIISFLKWYKARLKDGRTYSIAKGGYPDSTTQSRIDWEGVKTYLNEVKESGYFSAVFINNIRHNFEGVDSIMAKMPPSKYITKIPGMDADFIFPTYEPEGFLDHIAEAKTRKFYRIYDKAIVSVSFSRYTNLIFTLTKNIETRKWEIDDIGYDDPELYRLYK